MTIRCSKCGRILEVPGALVFSPPDEDGACMKFHVCVECFKRLRDWLLLDLK